MPYGRLADGTWAQGLEGHWPKGEKTIFSRPEWWLVAEEPQTDPAAGVDTKPKRQFKNDVLEQVSDRPIAPLEWHNVLYEVKHRDIRVVVDGAEALTYQLPHEQPIQSFSLKVDGDKRSVGKAWFYAVAVEPLPRK